MKYAIEVLKKEHERQGILYKTEEQYSLFVNTPENKVLIDKILLGYQAKMLELQEAIFLLMENDGAIEVQ